MNISYHFFFLQKNVYCRINDLSYPVNDFMDNAVFQTASSAVYKWAGYKIVA